MATDESHEPALEPHRPLEERMRSAPPGSDLQLSQDSPRLGTPRLKSVLVVIGTLVTAAWWMYVNWPRVDVSDPVAIDEANPHAWFLPVHVSGPFWVTDIQGSCVIREVDYETGYQLDAWEYADPEGLNQEVVSEHQRLDVQCPQLFWIARNGKDLQLGFLGGADIGSKHPSPPGYEPLRVERALVEIKLEYSPLSWLPRQVKQTRFGAASASDSSLRWRRAGQGETVLTNPAKGMRAFIRRCRSEKSTAKAYSYAVTMQRDPGQPPPGCPE